MKKWLKTIGLIIVIILWADITRKLALTLWPLDKWLAVDAVCAATFFTLSIINDLVNHVANCRRAK